MPGLDNSTIYIFNIYIYTCALAKPGFCSGGRISCKPNSGAVLSTSIDKHDSKSPNYCALLGACTNNSSDSESIGAGMGLLLAVKIVTFIVQSSTNVTLIATMVLIIVT